MLLRPGSWRATKRLVTLAATTAGTCFLLAVVAAPALATGGGAVATFTTAPVSTAAGSDPNIDSTIAFSYTHAGDSVKNLTVTLPPGLLAAPVNVPQSCSPAQLAAMKCPAGSKIGSGTAVTTPSVGSVTNNVYLMPATGGNVANIGAILYLNLGLGPIAIASANGALNLETVGGQPVGVLSVFNLPDNVNGLPVSVDSLTITVDGKTADGKPFTRLPTGCTVATSTLSIDTYSANADGSGSDSFTPTGCSTLPYSPTFSATAVKDANDDGVTFSTTIQQNPALSQAATKTTQLTVPTTILAPNPALLGLACGNADPATCPASATVGTVTATSPLLAPQLSGRIVVVQHSGGLPGLAIVLTSPSKVELTATVAATNAGIVTTFSGQPDIPLSSLTVSLSGGTHSAFQTLCTANTAAIGGVFTGQNGKVVSLKAPVTVKGCPAIAGPPTASSGALTGLAHGKPKLSFKLKAGENAPKLKSFVLSLPSGVTVVSKQLKSGLKLSGARLGAATVRHGELVVTLKAAVSSVTVKLSRKAITARAGLIGRAKKHELGKLAGSVAVTDASGTTTQLALPFRKLN